MPDEIKPDASSDEELQAAGGDAVESEVAEAGPEQEESPELDEAVENEAEAGAEASEEPGGEPVADDAAAADHE